MSGVRSNSTNSSDDDEVEDKGEISETIELTVAEKDRFIRENWEDLDHTSNFPDGTSCSEYAMEFFRNEHRVRQKRSRNNT